MTLYLDVIWFLNLLIDYLLISLTALVLKRRFQHIRMILAALFASLIVFLMFSPISDLFYQPWMKFLYSAGIVFIAFGYKRFRYFIQGLLMFYFVAFMTGGGLFALHFFWQTEITVLDGMVQANSGYFGSGISWVFVLIGFPLIWFFSKHRFEDIEIKQVQYESLVDVFITISGYTISVRGLVDSGNQLSDPLTKKPVMIIEASLLYPHFGKEVIDHLITFHEHPEIEINSEHKLIERASIIPYRVIGQSSPFITGLKPDHVKIHYQNQVFETKNVLLGLHDKELSPDGAFTCIVHPKLVLGVSTDKLA
ncbi:sigma-E processing peptidase SpoIIGA [Halalkalibacter akibai]|uniref:Sporulation sigma-E factor-processing peptidase n=1 Tax=Halalkalibacter akibai (strain ATCC 43226 / DSM 21942 / CIP 109018 / JCM 9157 / 1139) TaxID=1236973 RepID=W4QP23_HALA3|nr:sigma-E processing peptidase SpoIIGA [Halalkalibacter akibai]GAE33865.1 sporulation sigma-E factor processing peptidase [Halalkalibacter akibai JCM 9157]